MRNYKTAISFLKSSEKITKAEGKHKGLDFEIRKYMKKALGLSDAAPNSYLYAPTEKGGIGLTSAFDEYKIQSIVQMHSMINVKDKYLRDLVRKSK